MTEELSERELWHGGPVAFGMLFDRHARAVYNHCFRLTASWAEAEDLTQQTFLTAWRRRADLEPAGGSVLPWLLVTATNIARTARRSLRRRLGLLARLPDPGFQADHADDVADRIDAQRRMAGLRAALAVLSRAEREAFELVVWSGVGYPEAAVALGIAEGSVRSRVSRARARLSARTTIDKEL
ncbi:RNA polymerase sigma factor [Longispora sp. K20-0274]|uniref:RNA polymerase sigma factor n=1 Tax=Longispora sp. K20-0274 TaxID=3088255 RepID=UPI00399A75DB